MMSLDDVDMPFKYSLYEASLDYTRACTIYPKLIDFITFVDLKSFNELSYSQINKFIKLVYEEMDELLAESLTDICDRASHVEFLKSMSVAPEATIYLLLKTKIDDLFDVVQTAKAYQLQLEVK